MPIVYNTSNNQGRKTETWTRDRTICRTKLGTAIQSASGKNSFMMKHQQSQGWDVGMEALRSIFFFQPNHLFPHGGSHMTMREIAYQLIKEGQAAKASLDELVRRKSDARKVADRVARRKKIEAEAERLTDVIAGFADMIGVEFQEIRYCGCRRAKLVITG